MCSGRKVFIVHVVHQEQGSKKKKLVSGLGIRGEMHGEVLWSLKSISKECSPVVSDTSILQSEDKLLFEICMVYLFTCSVKGAWSLKMIISSNLKQRWARLLILNLFLPLASFKPRFTLKGLQYCFTLPRILPEGRDTVILWCAQGKQHLVQPGDLWRYRNSLSSSS